MVTGAEAAIVVRLRAAGCVFAEDEARLLVEATADPDELERLVADRVSGLPLEHLLGWAEFFGLRIRLDRGVFVPRRRTEFLATLAIDHLSPGCVVVDLCCGAGAIAAAVLSVEPAADVYAADIDPAAVGTARRNIPADRVFEGDLFDALPAALRGRIDILVANTPYVPTDEIALMPPEARLHEAQVALDGGPDGLDVQRRVARESIRWLTVGGVLLVETSEDQAEVTAQIFRDAGLTPRIDRSEEYFATVVSGTLD